MDETQPDNFKNIPDSEFPSKIFHNNFEYTKKDCTKSTIQYRCSHYRSKKCKGLFLLHKSTGRLDDSGIQHFCKEKLIPDFQKNTMKELIEEVKTRALNNFGLSATKIWNSVLKKINENNFDKDQIFVAPSKEAICNIVYNERRSYIGSGSDQKVDISQYSSLSENDQRLFLKFDFKYEIPNEPKFNNDLHRMLVWIHPDLLPILKRKKIDCFIDGTFRCVPKPFFQCIILMAFDDETELFVPIVYSLVQNKHEWTYWNFLNLVLIGTEMKFDPQTITMDFEKALQNAVKDQFPCANRIGCLFHFKQALRRKLIKLRIPDEQIHQVMQKNMLERLTKVNKNQINMAISQIRSEVNETPYQSKWDDFYKYFLGTWMNKFDFCIWNISDRDGDDLRSISMTNNGLENFNRQLNLEFSTAHPNIYNFIETIRKISSIYVENIVEIRSGRSRHKIRKY